jgi:acyl carrier protein
MNEQIRALLKEHLHLSNDIGSLADDADLYAAGLSSFATVHLMLGLEEAFDVEFPDRMLQRRTFESIAAIRTAVSELLAEKGTA